MKLKSHIKSNIHIYIFYKVDLCMHGDLTDSLGLPARESQAPNWLHIPISEIASIILSYAAFHLVSGNPTPMN